MTLHELDKLQSDPATAKVCPEHGARLGVRADQRLVCGVVVERGRDEKGNNRMKFCPYTTVHD